MGDSAQRWNIVDTSTPVEETVTTAPEVETTERQAHRWNVPEGTTLAADNVYVGATGPRGPAGPSGYPGLDVTQYGAIGDGVTDDTAAIQAALVASAGATLYFPPGNYGFSTKMVVLSDTTIIGNPGRSVLTKLGTPDPTDYDDNTCFHNDHWDVVPVDSDIHLYGLTINFPDAAIEGPGDCVRFYGVTRFSVDHCTMKPGNGSGITAFAGSSQGSITNNYVHDYLNVGIQVSDVHDVLINGNRVSDGGDGISCWATDGETCYRNTIADNVVTGCSAYAIIAGDGVTTGTNAQFTVQGNVVDLSNYGIMASGSDLTIVGNAINHSGGDGIVVRAAPADIAHIVVSGNTVSGYDETVTWAGPGISIGSRYRSGYGIYDVTVSNNVVSDCCKDGIRLFAEGASAVIGRVSVTGNLLNGNARSQEVFGSQEYAYMSGIGLYTDNGGYIWTVNIVNNIAYDRKASPTQQFGVDINDVGCEYLIITDNDFYDNVAGSIRINGIGHLIKRNTGYTNENGGIVSCADAAYFPHGMAVTPSRYGICALAADRSIAIIAVDATNIAISLKVASSGAAVSTPENVSWWAEG